MAEERHDDIIFNKKVADRIKELRIKINPIQAHFARDNYIDRQLLNRWENQNDKRGISIHSIRRFCNMINISLKDFFDDERF
ncbi:transcriptional regulator [Seonamhaeicola sp. S2-3]|uniref:helix-turn-helix domain-containing protein n=1 Tax=Seonamhaeicola sp. S2-3 TaxID=1936081 RepID=UPI000972D0A5|nr:helix-turn-helix transcriptional regulator [Seonamhaeicola sp. S2-3]APY10452.1 transcriptional regulator [Seonamhaeicola sp. S2-3]